MDQIPSESHRERDIYVHGGCFFFVMESYLIKIIGLPNWNAYFQKKLLSSSEKVGKSSKNAFEVAIPLYNFNEIDTFVFLNFKEDLFFFGYSPLAAFVLSTNTVL